MAEQSDKKQTPSLGVIVLGAKYHLGLYIQCLAKFAKKNESVKIAGGYAYALTFATNDGDIIVYISQADRISETVIPDAYIRIINTISSDATVELANEASNEFIRKTRNAGIEAPIALCYNTNACTRVNLCKGEHTCIDYKVRIDNCNCKFYSINTTKNINILAQLQDIIAYYADDLYII
jgi:hypothetical protein